MATLVDDNQMMFDMLLSTESQPLVTLVAGSGITIVIDSAGVATISLT